jgi:hypothetical protein
MDELIHCLQQALAKYEQTPTTKLARLIRLLEVEIAERNGACTPHPDKHDLLMGIASSARIGRHTNASSASNHRTRHRQWLTEATCPFES